MTTLRTAAQQALEALSEVDNCTYINDYGDAALDTAYESGMVCKAIAALRAALAQQEEPQTIDEAMRLPRAMAQAYEAGYKAGAAAERKRIIQFLTEMQRQVGDGHNYYGVAAMRIREMV